MKRLRYALQDLAFVLATAARRLAQSLRRAGPWVRSLPSRLRNAALALRGAGDDLRALWLRLSLRARRRISRALAAALLLAAIWFLAIPNLPCQVPGGDRCPPSDDAAELVPAGALAYLHANLDPDTDQYEAASELAARIPSLTKQLTALAPTPGGPSVSFERQVLPWLDGEVALAVLATGGSPEQVFLLEAGDEAGAERFARQLVGEGASTEKRAGVQVRVGEGGVATALTGGFLAIGTEAAVQRVLDTGNADVRSLADLPIAEAVSDGLPDDSIAEAYVSEGGVERLLAGAAGPLGTLDTFVNFDAAAGAGAALVASADGIELEIHSELDPRRLRASPGFFDAFLHFEPSLSEELSPRTLAYLGLGDPEVSIEALLAQARSQAPGLFAGFERLSRRLRTQERIDVQREALPLLGGEAALTIEPSGPVAAKGKRKRPQGILRPSGVPYLTLIGTEVDTEAASEALAKLQGPLLRALDTEATGQAPTFEDGEVDGVATHSVHISPTVNLTYAAFDERLVVSTDPAGVAQQVHGEGGLDDFRPFERAIEDFPERPVLLAYLNLGQLVTLAEREGLAQDPAYALLAGEIRRLAAAGLAVETGEAEQDTRLRVVLGQQEG